MLSAAPGTYAVLLHRATSTRAQIGRWGILEVRAGYYTYVGSAFGPGGLAARVGRHLRGSEARRWHVDHLRAVTQPVAAWCAPDPERLEHLWARAFSELPGVESTPRFGCSDCRCPSHLFFTQAPPDQRAFAEAARALVGREIPIEVITAW